MRRSRSWRSTALAVAAAAVVAACVGSAAAADRDDALPDETSAAAARASDRLDDDDSLQARREQVRRGRVLTATHACAGCHGGTPDAVNERYLSGQRSADNEFLIGPCATRADATPCFRTRARNLTPDNATGLGRFSERQIFNALRYGLRPGETPDVAITSMTPGEGNFPASPKYLAPPMPWPAWRHMTDQQLWDIAAYLKHGVKPVRNRVPDSEGPPDFWASAYTVAEIGTYPLPPFPAAQEREPMAPSPATARTP